MRTFAEQLTHEYTADSIKVRELLQELLEDDDIGGLLDHVAAIYVHGIGDGRLFRLENWISNAVADEVAERQRKHDDRMLASFDGEDPGR